MRGAALGTWTLRASLETLCLGADPPGCYPFRMSKHPTSHPSSGLDHEAVTRTWWQKALILAAGVAVVVSLIGSAIFVTVSLMGAFG